MKRLLLTTLLFLLAPASAHAAYAPSLKFDTNFAPLSGIAQDDFDPGAQFAIDTAAGVAVVGDRIYTVGAAVKSSDTGVGVIARHTNGAYDNTFGSGGKLVVQLATGKSDSAFAVVALPDGRLRIAADVDQGSGSTVNRDVALVGLLPNGAPDPSFGDGGDGIEIFAVGLENDSPTGLAVDAQGRLAVIGYTTSSNLRDSFVALRNPDGSAVSSFGTGGIRTIAGNGTYDDSGVDVVFRPDSGLVALLDVTTTVAVGGKKGELAVLRALTPNGSDDPSFGNAGEVVLNVGEPDTTPTDLLEHRGRLWVSGATYSAADQNAFVARVESDGSGQRSRQFDFRGTYTGSDAILSLAGGMTMLSGPPETLVVVGHGTFTTGTQFAAGAFSGFDGDLAAASYGDAVAGGSNQYSLSSAEPDGPTSVAAIGSFISTSGNIDGSFATTRLLLDADKKCDLALDVPTPLELTFVGRKGTAAQISVENKGERPCGGEVTVAAPYKLGRAVSTGVIEPGAKFVTSNVPVTSSTIRRDDDVAKFSISVPGDGDTSNDVRGVRAVYSFCDLALSAVEKPSTIPNEGGRRVEVGVRNSGTRTCRSVKFSVPNGAGEGASRPYAIERGRSVSDDVWVSSKNTAKVGKKATVTVKSASADEDVIATNDSIRLTARVVGVGDTRVRATSATRISGSATGGKGTKADRKGIKLTRVEVAIRKLGSGCRWLSGKKFSNRKTDACTPSGWKRASGKGSWSLRLTKLPAGRYEVYTRAVTANTFKEGRFSTKDGNRRAFRVR